MVHTLSFVMATLAKNDSWIKTPCLLSSNSRPMIWGGNNINILGQDGGNLVRLSTSRGFCQMACSCIDVEPHTMCHYHGALGINV